MTATVNIATAATSLLKEAQEASSARAARTLEAQAHAQLKQTMLALCTGQSLADHTAPGPASVMVLHGAVTLRSSEGPLDLSADDWAPIPRTTHSLIANDDAVVLLTIAAEAGTR